MFWLTKSAKTSKLFIRNIFPNVICRKAPRIGSPFKKIIKGDFDEKKKIA